MLVAAATAAVIAINEEQLIIDIAEVRVGCSSFEVLAYFFVIQKTTTTVRESVN